MPARRRAGVDRLRLLLAWADLHSSDPQALPGAVPVSRGGDRLITLGGEGTPQVQELCWAEVAIALESGVVAVRNQAGQALDLRHRLPSLWAAVTALRVEPWVAQKIATLTRPLARDRVRLVDAAVAAAVEESPGRLLAIAEAKTIEADVEAHRARLAEDARRTGVWVSRPRPGDLLDDAEGEPATRRVSGKVSAAEALEGDAMVDDVADALAAHGEHDPDDQPTRDQLRAQAFALLLTNPEGAAALLRQDPDDDAGSAISTRKRRKAVLQIHLTDLVLAGAVDGVARAEGIGPLLVEQVADLVRHRDITLQPVIDLNAVHAVNGYEHPTLVKERARLRNVHDVFPHSASRGTARFDYDHATPYDSGGPPGQTGDRNVAPLTRHHHRAKTHLPYEVCQVGLGAYRWTTPHGLARVVTPRGTTKVELLRMPDGRVIGEVYPHPTVTITIDDPPDG